MLRVMPRATAAPLLQTPGMPMPQYPYGNSNPPVTVQGPPPQPRPPEDSWATPSVYGVQPRYPWPTAAVHGNPFSSESHPPWTGSAAPAHTPAWDPQVRLMLPQPVLGAGCSQTSGTTRLSSKAASGPCEQPFP